MRKLFVLPRLGHLAGGNRVCMLAGNKLPVASYQLENHIYKDVKVDMIVNQIQNLYLRFSCYNRWQNNSNHHPIKNLLSFLLP